MSLGVILGGIGAAGQIFGIGRHGYGQANQYMGQGVNALNGMNQIATQYGGLGQQNLGQYQQYDPEYQAALQRQIDNLQQYAGGPTSTQAVADRNALRGNYAQGAQAANAYLTSQLAQRGLDTASSGRASSALTGGLANIAQGLGQNYAQAAYGASNLERQRQMDALGQIQGLYNGAASQAYGRGMGALGAQSGLLNNVFGGYSNLANQSAQMVGAQNAAVSQGWNSLAGLGGQIYGMQAYQSMFAPQQQQGAQGQVGPWQPGDGGPVVNPNPGGQVPQMPAPGSGVPAVPPAPGYPTAPTNPVTNVYPWSPPPQTYSPSMTNFNPFLPG